MEIKHALIAVTYGDNEMEVSHFCGYQKQPTEDDYNSLSKRLRTDPQYGMTEAEKYQIQEASSALIKYYKNLEPKDEDAYYVDETGEVVKW